MDEKDFVALILVAGVIPMCILANMVSKGIRDLCFFGMIALTCITFKIDINFLSHFWYRGTTRGIEVSLVDVLAIGVLFGSLLAPRRGVVRWFWPTALGLMLLFFAFACFNVGYSEPKIYGLFELSKMVRGIIFFLAAAMFVRGERELAILVAGLCCASCFEGLVALKQKLHDGYLRVPGTLDDANSLSMYMCMIAPVFVAAINSTLPRLIRQFSVLALLSAGICIVLTISRAGIPIFGMVVMGTTLATISLRLTVKKIVGAAFVCLCLCGVVYKSWDMIETRYTTDSLKSEYLDNTAFESRGYYLRLMELIVADHPNGVGLNNWSYWVSKKYGGKVGPAFSDYDDLVYTPVKYRPNNNYAAPAHCLAALTLGELGYAGLFLFALVWFRWFQMGAPFLWPRTPVATRRMGVGIFFATWGVFLQSITEWVFHQTHIYLTFHALMGTLAALYWMRRQELKAWKEAQEFEWDDDVEEEAEPYEHEPVVVA